MYAELAKKIWNAKDTEEIRNIVGIIENILSSNQKITYIDAIDAVIDKVASIMSAQKKNYTPFVSVKKIKRSRLESILDKINEELVRECSDPHKSRNFLSCLFEKLKKTESDVKIIAFYDDYISKNSQTILLITNLLS